MAWDFSTDPEWQEQLDWAEEFCKNEIAPLDLVFPYAVRSKDPRIKAIVDPLKQQVKDRGLWALFLDEDLGGPGLGQLKLALINETLGRYGSAPAIFGTAAPDTGNMEILAAYGTDVQKERWLYPLMNQEIFSAYSMTEPQGGSDPNLFKTIATRDGEEWVINGEKWFTSAGRAADILLVMCVNGMFIVPRETPGVEIMPYPSTHNHIRYNDVRVPLDHLLGPEDGAKVLAQRRLGGGRIHHAMRTIAQCKLAFDMMCERALSRESHGKIIADHQMVQEAIADSYAEINMLRLLVLWTAWTIDNSSTQEAHTDRRLQVHLLQGAEGRVVPCAAHHGFTGDDEPHPIARHVRRRAVHGHRRWRRRSAQGDGCSQRAEGLPTPRGPVADRVHPGEARRGP